MVYRPRVFELPTLQLGLLRRLQRDYELYRCFIQRLRSFYDIIAEHGQNSAPLVPSMLPDPLPPERELLSDTAHVSWQFEIQQGMDSVKSQFAVSLIDRFMSWEQIDGPTQWWTDIEIVFVLAMDVQFPFPHVNHLGEWSLKPLGNFFERPTLAKILKLVGGVLDEAFHLMSVDSFRCRGCCSPGVNIFAKGPGTFLQLPAHLREQLRVKLLSYTSRWPVRAARDLARPI